MNRIVSAIFSSLCSYVFVTEDWLEQCFDSSKTLEDMDEEKYQPTFTEVDELSTGKIMIDFN